MVNLSSKNHRKGRLDFENFQYASSKCFSLIGAYARSNLANLLFTYELERRLRKANINAMVVMGALRSINRNKMPVKIRLSRSLCRSKPYANSA
jgi:hypothetical protein